MDEARQLIISRFESMLDELAVEGYDIEALLDDWQTRPEDFSPLADMLLSPTGEPVTLAELADRFGVDPDLARRTWRTLGFVDEKLKAGDGAVIELLASMLAVLGEQAALQIAAVIGQGARRLAETEVAEVRLRREVPLRFGGADSFDVDFANDVRLLTQTYLPIVSAAIDVVHRRHIMITAAQTWRVDDEASATMSDRLIGFTDVAGFTARSGEADASELMGLIRAFESTVGEVVVAGNGRIVKLIGDAVMFSTETADQGCNIAIALTDALRAHELVMHTGLAFGGVLDHGGDYYGPTVNLASRLADLAEPGEIVVGSTVAATAAGHQFEPLGSTVIRGFQTPQDRWLLV